MEKDNYYWAVVNGSLKLCYLNGGGDWHDANSGEKVTPTKTLNRTDPPSCPDGCHCVKNPITGHWDIDC